MARQCYTARAPSALLRHPRHHPELLPVSFHPSMGSRPRSVVPASLSLVLPGLVWPGSGISASLAQLELPALCNLLGRSQLRHGAALPWLHWLPQQFGCDELPWAELRLTGEDGLTEASPHILCADPVSLSFSSDALLLRGPHELALTPEETAAILAMLNNEFSDIGEWISASPTRFYLLASQAAETYFHPLSDVLGRPVAFFPPEGERAQQWNHLSNEIQIALHNHPINRLRSEQGRLTVNGLWFWGQTNQALKTLKPPAAHLHSTDHVLRGLARRSQGIQLIDNPERIFAGLPGHAWIHNASLQESAQSGDFTGWMKALQRIEEDLIQPACAAWQAGRISEITLLAPSDKTLFSATLARRARWSFWRRPLDKTALPGLLQNKAPVP